MKKLRQNDFEKPQSTALIINPVPNDYILKYGFDGNFFDQSINHQHGIKAGTVNFSEGRFPKTLCAEFTNGCITTPNVLPVNSDKLTISFFIKTTQISAGIVCEMGPNFNSDNTFCVVNNDPVNEKFNLIAAGTSNYGPSEVYKSISHINDGVWKHIIIIFDRALTDQKVFIYNNLILDNIVSLSNPTITGNFTNKVLNIGMRNAQFSPLNAKIQDFTIYNRVLNEVEREQLFNEKILI